MYKFFTISLFCLISSLTQSQNLSFRVFEANEKPLEGATVFLLLAKDSSLVKSEISDAQGQVSFQTDVAKRYQVYINYVGFKPFREDAAVLGQARKVLLQAASNELATVTVAVKKPMFEIKPDKLVFNVENSTLATGNSALELLRKSPGVIIDQNDNIALRGKNGVRIFIDNKPSPLGAADLAAMLQGMQAGDIEAIEIIANPSARYDAAGNAGIINIRLKKNKNYGTNGSLSLGATYTPYLRGNTNLSLNHRNQNVNVFGSLGINGGENWNFFDFYRRQNGLIFDQKTESTWQSINNTFKTGIDWTINDKHSIGAVVNGFANWSKSESVTNAPVYLASSPDRMTELLLSENNRNGHRHNFNTNLNYTWTVDKKRSLTADVDFGTFDLYGNERVPNRYVNPISPSEAISELIFRSETPTLINLLSFQTDWSQTIGKAKLNAGAKLATVRTDNTFNFFNEVNSQANFDVQRSNQFIYHEDISAGYVQLSREKGKWSMEAGLRGEYTNSQGDLQSANDIADKNVRRRYLDFFPSAGVSYQANQNNRWGFRYSRRIDRPVYADLNPFEYRINELTYSKGNPFLLPQYTHNVEVSHTWKWTLNTALSYSFVNNYFANVSDTIEGRRSFLRKENFDKQEVLNLTSGYPFTLNKWWSGYATVTASATRYRAEFAPGKFIRIDNYALSTYMQNNFKLNQRFNLELSGSYNTPNVWGGTYRNRVFWFADAGIQYKADRLTLRAVVGDIFLSMRWRGVAEFGGLYAVASGGWDSRQLRLNATYNFGKSTVKKAKQRQSSGEDLKKRVE